MTNFYVVDNKMKQRSGCSCKCHFGGAVSCPGCKDNHKSEHEGEHCD